MAGVTVPYEFDPATVDLILEGLDHLPHGRVRRAYDAIRSHAITTMNPPSQAQDEQQPAPRRLPAGRYKKAR